MVQRVRWFWGLTLRFAEVFCDRFLGGAKRLITRVFSLRVLEWFGPGALPQAWRAFSPLGRADGSWATPHAGIGCAVGLLVQVSRGRWWGPARFRARRCLLAEFDHYFAQGGGFDQGVGGGDVFGGEGEVVVVEEGTEFVGVGEGGDFAEDGAVVGLGLG
jgi:hypothetical protein